MKRTFTLCITLIGIFLSTFCQAQSGYIYTVVGNGTGGYAGDGGPATAAELNNPTDIFKDAAGNLYIADHNNNRIRKVSTTGIITTIAGTGTAGYSGDTGPATAAKLRKPNSVCTDAAGNVYIADENNNVIRMINTSGIINTVAGNGTAGFFGDGGAATLAELNDPEAVAVDNSGNMYIADNNNSRIRMVNTSGIISTIAGGGATPFATDGTPATSAQLCNMRDVSVDNSGNVFFTNQGCYHVLRLTAGLLYDLAGAVTAAYTGDCGPADSADISGPYGVYPDNLGNVYICPRGNVRVRKVNTLDYITTVVGNGVAGYTGDGGPSIDATVSSTITGIYADPTGNVYFADAGNNVIRNFTSSNYSDTVTIPICAGGTDTLHDTSGYGIWSSSNTGIAIVGSGSGIVTGVSSGTSIITFTNAACPELFLVNITEPVIAGAAVCVGGNVTLSDTTSSGGVWTSGATAIATVGSSSGVVHGVSPGTVVITYTVGHCYSIATVTVNSQPSPISGTSALLCAGSTISLSDTASGGVWTSSSTGVATIGSTGSLLGVSPGTTTISYVVAGSCYATAVATVNLQPVAIIGDTQICQGNSITLSDATAGGTWTSSATAIATAGSLTGVIYGASVGTAVVTYGISSCYVTAIVTVNTQPAAISLTSGVASMCNGSSIALTDATTGGTWSSTNTAVATVGTDGTVTGVAVGTSTIIYIIGSCSVSQVVTVNTQPTAINGNTPVCQTFSITLTDAITGGTWSSNNTSVATVTGGVVTGGNVGTAVITYAIGSCYVTAIVTVNTQPSPITITGGGTASICAGSSLSLTDATAGVTWSSSNIVVATVGTDGTVTGIAPGTSTIICGSGSCTVDLVVTVNIQPVAITGNTTPICTGSTISLTDATGGGLWTSVTPTIGSVSATGVVTGVAVGTTIISYAIGSCVATTIVSVNLQPTAILGNPAICQGTYALTDATGGGIWSSSNIAVASVGTAGSGGDVYGASVGTAYVTYSLEFTIGSGACTVTQEVTVNPQPTAINGNTAAICQTFTLPLTDDVSGGTWSSSTPATGTVSATGVVTGIGVGTTTITYSIGTCYTTTIVTVNTQPAAITGIATICDGYTTILSDVTTGGTWSSSNTGVATVTGGTVTASTVGTATIFYTIGTCYSAQEVIVNSQPVAISGNTGPICQTFTLPLTDATTGGAWSSVTPTVGTVSGTGVVTGIGAGTTVISYAIGSCAVTTIVTVDTQPASITGTLSVCVGLTTSLSDATGAGTWSSTNTASGSISATGIVTGIAGGTTTISYTLGICAAEAVVTVIPLPAAITGNTGPICQTFTLPLTDATSGGAWTSVTTTVGTVSTTGIVTGIGAGTTIISYGLNGCASTTIVTVDTQPATISGTLSVCVGLTTSLTDGTGGGTWSSTNTTVGSISATGIVTGILNGTTTISYTLGICAATGIVTVDPLPVAISGTKTVCSGATVSLSDATGGGTWSSSNTAIATVGVTSGMVTGQTVAVTSTATITYTIGTGCIITAVVTVNPLPASISGPTEVCLGSTVTLSDASTGTWSSNNILIATIGSATGLVTGVGVGVTTITFKIATGCYVTAPMTVNPLPVTITGPTLVCVGSTITLSDLSAGGTWSSSNTSSATAGSGTGIITGVASGTATITYTLGTGCYTTHAVTVNTPASIITPVGDTTFCPGGFVALTANTGAGLSYQWYVGGVAITGALSSSYIATASGSYQVQVTNANGCSAFSIPMTVTVATPIAAITAVGSPTICAGSSITLDANTGTGLSYQWLLGGVAIAGSVGSTLTTSLPGNYSVVVTNATGCSATSNVITVDTISSPTANITLSGPLTFCQGDSVVMTANIAPGYTYQWYNGAIAITGATGTAYAATATGTYYVIVTNTNGCTATSVVVSVVVNPLPSVAITASGSTIFCSGGSVTLSAVGGDLYQWYDNGTAIAGATNSSYLVTASGGYEVQVTDPATGCSATTLADTNVTVVSTAIVMPVTPASFCWGGSSLLSTNLSGYSGTVTYQWYFNGAIIPGATGPTYDAAAPGNYSCQITIPGSCTVTSVAIPVTEYPLPNPIVTFDGTYFQTGNYYVTYQWYKNLVAIAGATTSSMPCTGTGDYKVAVTDTNGCQSYSDVFVDTSCTISGGGTTGITNVNKTAISIFPNPATSELTIRMGAGAYTSFTITNNVGQEMLTDQPLTHTTTQVNIATLPAGVYYITFRGDNGMAVQKFMKM